MARLYPPVIESTIHACYNENGMVKLTIPFSMNRAVSQAQVGGFEIKIKTVQTGTVLYTLKTFDPTNYTIDEVSSYVIFYLKDQKKKMKVGQFYKIQLAYIEIDKNKKESLYNSFINGYITLEEYEQKVAELGITGYYSSIGTTKYTTKPNIKINDFEENALNNFSNNYTGYYDQTNGDNSERVYSYHFDIYNLKDEIVASSGECLHNNSLDTNADWSIDNYFTGKDLPYDVIHKIQYTVTTVNKMVISSPKYRIIQRETIMPEIDVNLIVSQNFDNGYINIILEPHKDLYVQRAIDISAKENNSSWLNNIKTIKEKGFNEEQAAVLYANRNNLSSIINAASFKNCTGSFLLSRANENTEFSDWEPLCKIKFYEQVPKGIIYKDFTTIQGKKYIYSLQQYNDSGLYSKRLKSQVIIADFEDAFLYDGEKQLKIKYNLKMTKFANTVLEAKQDTIGSKYPHIFRNGQVSYYEFPLGGLISYFMDEEHLFLKENELITDEKTINYTTDNIAQERLFKIAVLEWLNNGKPKLFRSPTEGNFIVRLIKVSLAPEQKLGRLLHNFSSTAYEIMDYNNFNLQQLKIIDLTEDTSTQMRFYTVNLEDYSPGAILNNFNGSNISIESIKCEDLFFGDELLLTYENGSQEIIKLGITGNYYADKLLPLKGITILPRYRKNIHDVNESNYFNYFKKTVDGKYVRAESFEMNTEYYELSNPRLKGQMTFGYQNVAKNIFTTIKNVSYEKPSYQQFIGKNKDVLRSLTSIDNYLDVKKELVNLYYIKATKRPIDRIIQQNNNEDNNIYYYGLDVYSDKMKFTEIRYPIGLRAYEPNKYYVKLEDGSYVFDNGSYDFEITDFMGNVTGYRTYYLRGYYRKTRYPVGRTLYQPNTYYIKNGDNYEICKDPYDENVDYYTKFINDFGIAIYTKKEQLTGDKDYIFQAGKFYRLTDDGKHYTLANSYVNKRDYYYELVDYTQEQIANTANKDSLYVNAYVTINSKYVYKSRDYYAKVIETDIITGQEIEKYVRCNSGDFNIHAISKGIVEMGPYNGDVIRYYKLKPILPHILHIIGTQWEHAKIGSFRDVTGDNMTEYKYNDNYPEEDIINQYNFKPLMTEIGGKLCYNYIDFYNGERRYNEYEPWIKINGHQFEVRDTLFFSISDLKNLEKITSLECGNGVILEVGYQLRNLEYNIEDSLSAKEKYLEDLKTLDEKLDILNNPSHEDYIDLSAEPSNNKLSIYNSYFNNSYQKMVVSSYKSLISQIKTALNI